MKRIPVARAILSTPFYHTMDFDLRNSREEIARAAYMAVSNNYEGLTWSMGDFEGRPPVKLEAIQQAERLELEDGDEIPPEMAEDFDDVGVSTGEWSDMPAASDAATVTGGEDALAGSPEAEDQSELLESLVTALQSFCDLYDRRNSPNPPTEQDWQDAREEARAALAGALDPSDLDEQGQPVAE